MTGARAFTELLFVGQELLLIQKLGCCGAALSAVLFRDSPNHLTLAMRNNYLYSSITSATTAVVLSAMNFH